MKTADLASVFCSFRSVHLITVNIKKNNSQTLRPAAASLIPFF